MSDDLEFIVIDDIPEYIFCIGDDEENERVIALRGKDGAFKYEKVAELPTTGEDGVLYLVPKSHTTQTASGNPINVNITNNAGKIESLKLDGDTAQNSYTGKNLTPNIGSLSWLFNNITNRVIGDDEMTFTVSTSDNFSGVYMLKTDNYGICKYYFEDGYTVSFEISASEQTNFTVGQSGGTQTTYTVGTTPVRISAASGDANFVIYATSRNGASVSIKNIQVETGSTATDFEPYVGGVYSPNIDFSQAINVVTGSQTVAINDTSYPLDLGTIELCKIGTYQDYIYKSGDDWKVHKATVKKVLNGSEDWSDATVTGTTGYFRGSLAAGGYKTTLGYSDKMLVRQGSHGSYEYVWLQNTQGGNTYLQVLKSRLSASTLEAFETWLASNNITIYAVPYDDQADTTITDQTLIAQLEAVRTAALSTGSNTISNTATGTNLAGDLELGYYGYDPLNKYDKYFWLDVDGAYESL